MSRVSPMPLVLVSGHFGAGKSVFIQHYLGQYRGGALATAVFSRSESPLDVTIIRSTIRSVPRKRDLIVDIRVDGPQDTEKNTDWRTTFSRAVRDAAHSNLFDRMLVELDPSQDPEEIARIAAAASPDRPVPVGCHFRIIDAPAFFHEVVRVDPSRVTPEWLAKKPWMAFTESQTEALKTADVVVLRASIGEEFRAEEAAACEQFIQLMQPGARILSKQSEELEWQDFTFTGNSVIGSLTDKALATDSSAPAFPYTETWLFKARRPFHPERLADVFFVEWPELARMKGLYWLATRPNIVAGLSWAGPSFWSGMSGYWWSAVEMKHWPTETEERNRIDDLWEEPYGDRRQELLVVGAPRIPGGLMLALQNALLTDEEMELGPATWMLFPDPLPDITAEVDE
ncbi:MAG: GTP-binding protein [Candidatus Methylacidiphilales bacterium]|nr:GTP-binding protein [Candidatus Methylacidiphilales bacterium]